MAGTCFRYYKKKLIEYDIIGASSL